MEEFGRLTPAMFNALLERREVAFRYQCLCAGLIASTLLNMHMKPDSTRVSPYDFAPTVADDNERERDRAKQNLVSLFAMIEGSPDFFERMRDKAIAGLKADGFEDAEEIFEEVFAAWNVNGSNRSRNITG